MKQMKRIIWVFIFACLTATAAAEFSKMMSVQIREGQVRAAPSFLGRIVGTVAYGDRVAVESEKQSWSFIRSADKQIEGWMHRSALTPKKIVLKAGASDVETTVTTQEIALAGKGFNEQVEKEYKTKNPDKDFSWIDRMEQIDVSQEEMRQFLEEGGLFPEGGADGKK
jgi:SH3-like domain-containing protein